MIILFWLVAATAVEATTVGTIGAPITAASTNLPASFDDPSFCLNTANSATASGVISSINYCYRVQNSGIFAAFVDHQVTIGIYRPVNSNTFELVRPLPIDIPSSITSLCDTIDDFVPVEVQAGDAIGVCSSRFNILNSESRLVFNADTGRTRDVLRCSDDCTSAELVPSSIDKIDLLIVQERVLLINATIEEIGDLSTTEEEEDNQTPNTDGTRDRSTTVGPTEENPSISTSPTEVSSNSNVDSLLSRDQLTAVIAVCASLGFILLIVCSVPVVTFSIAAAIKFSRRKKELRVEQSTGENTYDYINDSAMMNYRQVHRESDFALMNLATSSKTPNMQDPHRYQYFQGKRGGDNIEMQKNECYRAFDDNSNDMSDSYI